MLDIQELKTASEETLKDINALLLELRKETTPGSLEELEDCVNNPNTTIVVAQDGEKIAGMGMLFVAQKLGRRMGIIEDVVVSRAYRGTGVGTDIMKKLIEAGRAKKLRTIDLTSNPEKGAGHFYEKLGFSVRDTSVYRMHL